MSLLLLNFDQKYKFSNKNNMVSAWRNFKNIFPRLLFIIIFRPEMLKFHPYSILTGDTRVEFVIYRVLIRLRNSSVFIPKLPGLGIMIFFSNLSTNRVWPNQAKSWKWVMFKTLLCQPKWFQVNVWYTLRKYTCSANNLSQFFFQNPKFIFGTFGFKSIKPAIVHCDK
jgi:hypothetical protein